MKKETINYVHFIHLLFKVRRMNFDVDYLLFLFVSGDGLLDMSSNLEWTDIEQHVRNVQKGKVKVVTYPLK